MSGERGVQGWGGVVGDCFLLLMCRRGDICVYRLVGRWDIYTLRLDQKSFDWPGYRVRWLIYQHSLLKASATVTRFLETCIYGTSISVYRVCEQNQIWDTMYHVCENDKKSIIYSILDKLSFHITFIIFLRKCFLNSGIWTSLTNVYWPDYECKICFHHMLIFMKVVPRSRVKLKWFVDLMGNKWMIDVVN